MTTDQLEAQTPLDGESKVSDSDSDSASDLAGASEVASGAGDEVSPLTPRAGTPTPPARRKRRLVSWMIVLAAFAGIGYLLYRTLDDASLFFLSVDRAVAQREDLGSRRFQLHGTPVPGTIQPITSNQQTFVRFSLAGDGSVAEVLHVGAPPDLFQPCVPVVLRGRWENSPADSDAVLDYHFSSTQILVKHDNDYTIPEDSDEGSAGEDFYEGATSVQTAENHHEATLARLEGCPNA